MPIIEIDGFKVYDGSQKSLIIEPEHIEEGMAFYLKQNLDGIAITEDHGYNLTHIDFLKDYPSIRHISISAGIANIEGIYYLKSLSSIILSGKNRKLDFSCFPQLKKLKADWSPHLINLGHINLEELSFYNYSPKNKNLEGLSEISKLKLLEIVQSTILTLEGLEGLGELQDVSFSYCPKLAVLDRLEKSSKTMKKLMLDHCKSIQNHDYVKRLTNLKILGYNDCGEIKSIKFIKEMPALEDFRFVNTTILDGDLSPCLGLKNVGFNNKKHYSHTSAQMKEMIKGISA